MKKIMNIFLAATMVLSLVACAEDKSNADSMSESDDRLKVGFSLPSMTFPFYVRMYDQILMEAESRDWDVTFVDGNLDAGTQLNGCQDLINANVDVMIIATWYIGALVDIFQQCEEKGIPVFIMDNMIIPEGSENAVTLTTGTDNYNAGVVGGTWYAAYLAEQGVSEINMVTVSAQQEQPIRRFKGFIDALGENGITVNTLNNYDGGKRETALAVSEDALTAFVDLELIFGSSAQDSLGAYDATTGANKTDVTVFGFDGEDEEIQLIDEGTNYLATITQDPSGQATLVAEHVDLWLAGTDFEQFKETPAGVYCADGQIKASDIITK